MILNPYTVAKILADSKFFTWNAIILQMFFIQNRSCIYLLKNWVLIQMICTSLHIFLHVRDFFLLCFHFWKNSKSSVSRYKIIAYNHWEIRYFCIISLFLVLFCNIKLYLSKILQPRFCKHFVHLFGTSQHQCNSFAMSFKAFVYTARILQKQCKSFASFPKYFVLEYKRFVKPASCWKTSKQTFLVHIMFLR